MISVGKEKWIRYYSSRESKEGILGTNRRCEVKGTKDSGVAEMCVVLHPMCNCQSVRL